MGLDPRKLVIKYGGHKDQLSRAFPKMDWFRVQAMARHLFDTTLSDDDFTALTEQMRFKLNILIQGAEKRGVSAQAYKKMERRVSDAINKRFTDGL